MALRFRLATPEWIARSRTLSPWLSLAGGAHTGKPGALGHRIGMTMIAQTGVSEIESSPKVFLTYMSPLSALFACPAEQAAKQERGFLACAGVRVVCCGSMGVHDAPRVPGSRRPSARPRLVWRERPLRGPVRSPVLHLQESLVGACACALEVGARCSVQRCL